MVEWVKSIRMDIDATQGPVLHFRNLGLKKKTRAAELLAERPARLFAVCSNKKNMRGWQNQRAEKRGGRQWFYNFCVRLLMERVTDFCYRDATKRFQNCRYLRVIFSKRGGHSYGQTKAYWEVLKNQSRAGTTVLAKRVINHEVLRFNLVDYVPHWQNAGLQLADIVASSFFQASNTLGSNWSTDPASQLRPRMAREGSVIADYGLVLQPTPPWKANLTDDQKIIFRSYGYAI